MNKEIEIPEGYTARIEDNKVVLEPKESEDEKTRKEMINYISQIKALSEHGCRSGWDIREEDAPKCERFLAYLEKHKESAWTEEDESFVTHILPRILNPDRWTLDQVSADKKYLTEFIERQKRKFTKEQKPAESDAIKGGDFISDGKRVFLVLANTKERNLGETGSTFCEGHILGVDGVVYCNGDDFKKFKRATSDERAKFIHDLKVGVELKEQPAEWSEEDMLNLDNIIWLCENCEKGIETTWIPSQATKIKHLMKSIKEGSVQKQEWGEEDEEMLRIISNRLDKFSEWATEQGFPIDDPTMKQSPIAWFKSLPERFNLQSKQEWSEEEKERIRQNGRLDVCYNPEKYGLCHKTEWSEKDKNFIKELCDLLASIAKNNYVGRYYAPDLVSKLQSLHPQPKQEWSEEDIKKIRSEEYTKGFNDAAFGGKLKEWSVEDEDRIRQIERIAQQAGCTQKLQEEIHNWLKSLRPQPHWKPSEEQMRAVFDASERNDKLGSILRNLYDDLKKL